MISSAYLYLSLELIFMVLSSPIGLNGFFMFVSWQVSFTGKNRFLRLVCFLTRIVSCTFRSLTFL